ncbi:MAG TPA: hypothetical protein VFS46_06150 [Nitrososphaera sp.]|nr:hypothetical protein [Nitrososphaera sp.]
MASCRSCGGELGPIASCPACEENVQWMCASCNKETDVSVHTHDGMIIGPADISAPRTETIAAAA